MNGVGLLLGKELREQARSMRLLVVVAVFAVLGLLSPVFARYAPRSSRRWVVASSAA
jgi:hypothetical protein